MHTFIHREVHIRTSKHIHVYIFLGVECRAARIALHNSKKFYRETLETRIEKERERERESERENERWKTKGFGLTGLLFRNSFQSP